jgi:hypothetical protein
MTPHQSDSTEQRSAEVQILAEASKKLGVEVAPARVHVSDGAYVDVDGTNDDRSVFIEIFAHLGKCKGGQVHKVQGDVLKLATLWRVHPDALAVLVFADEAAARCVRTGWLGEAAQTFGVEVVAIELPAAVRAAVQHAQDRQRMVNPAADPT